jgi:RNA methyltransferase, TrmH family
MLTSLQNPLVKQLRKLHRAKERRSQHLFLIEGTHLVEAACLAKRPLQTVCCTPEWEHRHAQLMDQVGLAAQRVERVSQEVLRAIATTTEPDGIVATIERHSTPTPQFTQLGLVLETIQDPGNLGTLIRTVAAVGADGILLSGDSVDLDHPKVLRASAGQWFQTPIAATDCLADALTTYQRQGFQLVATLSTAQQTYWQVDFCRPTLVLLGNEGAGLSPGIAQLADCAVQIPLQPGVESLNVAISAALILYEAQRQYLESSK